ncbi:MAG: hypothetical protein AB1589_22750 [Cyanobacteriota bacterium]
MRAYAALAEERYKLPTYPVLINILPPSALVVISNRYESQFRDLVARQESPWYQEILQQGLEQGLRQGLLLGIALGLELKFGNEGLQLMPEIREVENVEVLEAIQEAIKTVQTLDDLCQIYRTT